MDTSPPTESNDGNEKFPGKSLSYRYIVEPMCSNEEKSINTSVLSLYTKSILPDTFRSKGIEIVAK